MLQDAGYPDFYSHKLDHDKLVRLVLNYKVQPESGVSGIEGQAMSFIKTWRNGHILWHGPVIPPVSEEQGLGSHITAQRASFPAAPGTLAP